MPKVSITPTSSHSGGTDGTNVAGVTSIATAPTANKVATPTLTRAHLEFTITGPSNSFGSATFMAATADGRYLPVGTLTVRADGPKTIGQDVSLPNGTMSIIANVDSLIRGVGAVPSTSVTY